MQVAKVFIPNARNKEQFFNNYLKFNTEQASPLSCKKLGNNNRHLSYHHSACPVNASPCQVQSALLIVTPIVENLIKQSGCVAKLCRFFVPSWCQFTALCHNIVFCIQFCFFGLDVHNPPFFSRIVDP